jgi:type VI secretion system protein ImpL
MGEPGGGKSTLLKASAPLSSVGPIGAEGGTRNVDWWFFDKAVLLDTAGTYVFQDKDSEAATEWQTLLTLLKANRGREPINGVVVAVPADSLISKPIEKLKEQAAQLRERLDDLAQRLGVKFPVYLAVTKSDRIAGFIEFFQLLPDPVKGQALGFANQEMTSAAEALRLFDRGFRMIYERLELVRVSLLNDCESEELSRGMFLFPGELKSLQAPLKAFVDVLFRPSPYHDAPFFRGLFLTSARQGATPLSRLSYLLGQNYSHAMPTTPSREVFLRDFGSVILPADRTLIGQTATGRERYGLTRAAGAIIAMAASLLACGFLTLSFTNNWFALKSLDVMPCVNREGSNELAGALGPLDECRGNIENLLPSSFWKRLAMNFGLNESKQVASALQTRFIDAFRSQVLTTIDARIDQNLTIASANPMVVGTVMQRIQILGRCLDEGHCAALQPEQNLDYRVILTSGQGSQASVAMTAERLRRTHHAYLTWQNDTALRDMQSKDTDRIQRWLDGGGLREDRILDSASSAFPAVRAGDFWDSNGPVQVDPAYTAKAWREGIAPLISGLQSMTSKTSGVGESLKSFESNYRAQALRQWDEFLNSYPQMERLASQKRMTKEIALALGSDKSPAGMILQSAHDNLSVILGTVWQSGALPPWAATLKKFMVLKTKIVEAQKSGKTSSQGSAQGMEAEAAKFLSSYLTALDQIKADLSTPEKSFASAKKAFEDAESSSNSTQAVLKAAWSLNMLRATIGMSQQEDRLVWIMLGSPISIGWRAILEESGKYLQQQWEGLLLEVKDLDAGPKGGKIISFVNGSATSFLSRSGGAWTPKRVLNQAVPFTDAFVQYLTRLSADARQQSPSSTIFSTPTGSGPQPPPFIVRNS